MKDFLSIKFDAVECRRELDNMKKMLTTKHDLSERDDLQPLFKESPNLTVLIGSRIPEMGLANRIAYDFDIFGDFATDFVIGNHEKRAFCAVELEDARPKSILRKVQGRAMRQWGDRFEHGFGQLVDWFYAFDEHRKSARFTNCFGHGHVEFSGLLLIGRSDDVADHERVRLRWRSERVFVNRHKVNCRTYDDLYDDLDKDWRLIAPRNLKG